MKSARQLSCAASQMMKSLACRVIGGVAISRTDALAFAIVPVGVFPCVQLEISHWAERQSSLAVMALLIILLIGGLLFLRGGFSARGRKREEEKFRALLETAPDAMVIADSGGRIVLVNAEAEKIFGVECAHLCGKPMGTLIPAFAVGNDGEVAPRHFPDVAAKYLGLSTVLLGLRTNGEEFPLEVRLNPCETTEGVLFSCGICDITRRKMAEEGLRRTVRALRTRSSFNEALVRAENEHELVEVICRILVQKGGYRMAWVGQREYDQARTVRPVAHSGFEEGYLSVVPVTWDENTEGAGRRVPPSAAACLPLIATPIPTLPIPSGGRRLSIVVTPLRWQFPCGSAGKCGAYSAFMRWSPMPSTMRR